MFKSFLRFEQNRPHVTLKLALSLDGAIALASGESQWITGPQARAHAHLERARADAILVGGGTCRIDAPRLDVRLPGLEVRSPERWVLTHGATHEDWNAIASPAANSTARSTAHETGALHAGAGFLPLFLGQHGAQAEAHLGQVARQFVAGVGRFVGSVGGFAQIERRNTFASSK